MKIAIIDIIFLAIIAIFSLRSAIRGFISELLSMAAFILGFLSAIFFFRKAALIIRDRFLPEMKTLPEIISFVAIFLIVYAAIKLIELMLKEIIEGIKLNGPDHFLGFIFGFAEGVLVVCLLLFFINIQPFYPSGQILQGSFFADILLPFIMGTRREALDSVVRLYGLGRIISSV